MFEKKICLVTGANSGIGKEIAIELALLGAHVILVCRDLKKGQAALQEIKLLSTSNSLDLFIADLSSQVEIRTLAKAIIERYSTLHVLINNAGCVLSKKLFSINGIEMTLATNYLGPFLLTHLLADILKKSSPSRVINISSAIHKWAKLELNDLQYVHRKYNFMKVYAQSKLLMNIATFEFSRKFKDTGVTVNCVHPGAVKTGLGSNDGHHLFLKLIDKLVKFFFITPKKAAKKIVFLALAPELENTTGKYFVKGKEVLSSSITYDISLAKKVFEISEKMVGVS